MPALTLVRIQRTCATSCAGQEEPHAASALCGGVHGRELSSHGGCHQQGWRHTDHEAHRQHALPGSATRLLSCIDSHASGSPPAPLAPLAPQLPNYPGASDFQGYFIHSSEFRRVEDARGQQVRAQGLHAFTPRLILLSPVHPAYLCAYPPARLRSSPPLAVRHAGGACGQRAQPPGHGG